MEDFVTRVLKELGAMGPEVALAVVGAEEAKSPARHALGMTVLALERRDGAGAVEWGERAAGLSDDPVVLEHLGDAYELRADYVNAEVALRRSVERRAQRRNLAKLARVQLAQGKNAEAEDCFRRILASHPTNVNILQALAALRQKQNDFSEAAICYARAFEANPQDAAPLANLTALYAEAGRLHGAFAFALQARADQPPEELSVLLDLLMLQVAIATRREQQGRYPIGNIDEIANRLVNAAPRRPLRVQFAIARALLESARAADAARIVHPLEGRPMEDAERVLFYFTLGLIALTAGNSEVAIESFVRAVDLDPRQIEACSRAAGLLLDRNDAPSLARVDRLLARIPLEIKRQSPDILVREAIYFLRVGREADAERDLTAVAALTGGHGEIAAAALKLRATIAGKRVAPSAV